MSQIKRAGDDLTENLTESSMKNRKICTDGAETPDLLISGLPALHFSVHVLLQLSVGALTVVFHNVFITRLLTFSDANSEEPIDSFSDSGQSVWSELSKEVTSKISRNVVSIALSDGDYAI